MDFFDAQARAKKRTSRLVALFVLAVLGTIVAGYFAFIFLTASIGLRANAHGGGFERAPGGLDQVDLWQPGALIAFSLFTVAVVGLASLFKWFELRAGGRAVAQMVGAREVASNTILPRERQLLNIVEEMSIASGLPMPAVFVLEDETGINAFAAGLTTSDAVVTVTRGTLEKLNRDELQGVIAHEFSHILNGDMRLNVHLTAVLYGILVIALMGRGILSSLRYTRVRSSGNNKNGGGIIIAILAVGLVMLILGYIGYFFGRLIQAAVSRQREFLADASAVQFTRNPGGITGALKKIGGYALGSRVQSTKASELSHFFFAQGFRSNFGGLWATHPPLDVRIRAVDASFDGKYFEPPTLSDVATEPTGTRQSSRPAPSARSAINPLILAASVGALEPAHIANAQSLADSIPPLLREAVRTPAGAAAIACGLLLDADESIRSRQHGLIRQHAGDSISTALTPLESSLLALPRSPRLPLLLLTPPTLRQLAPADLARLVETLDELVHADDRVSLFEFSLQKVLARHLELAATPTNRRETYSPADVSNEISVVLSFGARVGAIDETAALTAFNAGAAQFAGLYPPVALRTPDLSELTHLDAALDKLALAYGPVKKRILTALATTVASDGTVDPDEAELVRALASALDCPMPALSA
ncbi:MAG: M48 family metallopeptidase [Opitutaceae bacterium]|jgi:Zn-dependent protease with chaperone function